MKISLQHRTKETNTKSYNDQPQQPTIKKLQSSLFTNKPTLTFRQNRKHACNLSAKAIHSNSASLPLQDFQSPFEENDSLDNQENFEFKSHNRIDNSESDVLPTKNQFLQLKQIVKVVLLLLSVSSASWMFNRFVRPNVGTFAVNDQLQSMRNTQGGAKDVQIVTVVPKEGLSSFGVPWLEVIEHTAQRMKWAQEDLNLKVFVEGSTNQEELGKELQNANVLVTIGAHDKQTIQTIQNSKNNINTILSLESSEELQKLTKLGQLQPHQQTSNPFLNLFPSEQQKKDKKLYETVLDLWRRKTSDDILYMYFVIVNAYVREVSQVSGVFRDPDVSSLQCMVNKCGKQIFQCLINESCRKAVGCLAECAPTDQICAYRCIASYESPELEQFSLCILQKHNCLNNVAEIQQLPNVPAMKSFRGESMTYEMAEDIFIGWFGEEKFSWRVAAGKNPAYDYFPCQFQLFYKGKAKNTMWYDPIFKVLTLDGREVWRKRHYRVRRQKTPGKFRFSVLDNGVTSLEDWTIVDCSEDLKWCLFYYTGAASTAGISYVGAIFATKSGDWPSVADDMRINAAFEACGIKPWELSTVDNTNCAGAPVVPVAEPAS